MRKDKTAVVFPGQGIQRTGMGKDFYDNISKSRITYEEASEALGYDVAALCFGGDEKINLTEYAQPCILTTEIAMFRSIESLYGFTADYFGGHSLGEYTALVAAGAMSFSDALKTVRARGHLMQQASPSGDGGMAAIIAEDLDIDVIRNTLNGLPLDIANINSTDQVVISGKTDSLDIAANRLKKAMGDGKELRIVPLNVSAPFHSRFMNAIVDRFKEILTSVSARLNPENAGRVTSNYTGGFHPCQKTGIIDNLVSQISGSVNWLENMKVLADKAQKIYEIGPGRPLRNFFKPIGISCSSITSFSAAQRAFAQGF